MESDVITMPIVSNIAKSAFPLSSVVSMCQNVASTTSDHRLTEIDGIKELEEARLGTIASCPDIDERADATPDSPDMFH